MSLEKVLEEIKKVKGFAEENIEEGPAETMGARRGRKNAAIERLRTLKEEYTRSLLSSAIFVVVTGSNRDEFTQMASERFGCFVANTEEFYEDLANRVPQALYLGKEGVSNVFDTLGRHLEDKATELGIVAYPMLLFKQQYRKTLKTQEDFRDLVKQAINDQIGAEVVGIQAVKSLTNNAIEKGHGARLTPILLTTGDETLALALNKDLERLTRRVFLVTAGKVTKQLKSVEDAVSIKEANEESVEKAMTTIRNSVKK